LRTGFFKDPIRVPRIENRVPRIREIGSLQVHTGYLTFFFKKTLIEQIFVSVRMQFHNHVDAQPVKRFDRTMRYICDIKFRMLQVRKNEISLRKCSGGSAHLRTLEGTLVTREI